MVHPTHHQNAHRGPLVGIFSTGHQAFAAVRRLDSVHVPPQNVTMIADDPHLAAELGAHSRATWGGLIGLALGLALGVLFIALGTRGFQSDPIGMSLGLIFVGGGLGFIGFQCGGTLQVPDPHTEEYARAVEDGGAIVSVRSSLKDVRDHARTALLQSGAGTVVDQSERNTGWTQGSSDSGP